MAEPQPDKTLDLSIFSPPEVEKMKRLIMNNDGELMDENFYEKLTQELNIVSGRIESETIQTEQVQAWFESIRKCQVNDGSSALIASQDLVPMDTNISLDEPRSLILLKETGGIDPEVTEWAFEAKSSRDEAWYDVGTFLSHRYLFSGEIEVRVRFKDFGPDDDEWVNVNSGVRERSIPFDSSDCKKVAVGDLVLCFRESNEHALYFDAHITEIDRKPHDSRSCSCIFSVRYDHDEVEGKVMARDLCRRPY